MHRSKERVHLGENTVVLKLLGLGGWAKNSQTQAKIYPNLQKWQLPSLFLPAPMIPLNAIPPNLFQEVLAHHQTNESYGLPS
jgi:hypothetical protein